jgi:hypothetical protein
LRTSSSWDLFVKEVQLFVVISNQQLISNFKDWTTSAKHLKNSSSQFNQSYKAIHLDSSTDIANTGKDFNDKFHLLAEVTSK